MIHFFIVYFVNKLGFKWTSISKKLANYFVERKPKRLMNKYNCLKEKNLLKDLLTQSKSLESLELMVKNENDDIDMKSFEQSTDQNDEWTELEVQLEITF